MVHNVKAEDSNDAEGWHEIRIVPPAREVIFATLGCKLLPLSEDEVAREQNEDAQPRQLNDRKHSHIFDGIIVFVVVDGVGLIER